KQARVHVDAGGLTVRTANAFIRDLGIKNLGDEIRASWEAVGGHGRPVEFAVDGGVPASNGHANWRAKGGRVERGPSGGMKSPEEVVSAKPQAARKGSHESGPSANVIAEPSGFVVGASNEYAFRAADLTGRGRQQASPLLFCGPSSVGKTHLLRGIVREYR